MMMRVVSAFRFTTDERTVPTIGAVLHVFRNMYNLLAYSDRDDRFVEPQSLDDTVYSAVLEELEGKESRMRRSAPIEPSESPPCSAQLLAG